MSTTVRPELSENNRYWVERHRYYELKHFCLQYPIWKKTYESINSMSHNVYDLSGISKSYAISDPTVKCAEARLFYFERLDMVERTAKEADYSLSDYILKAVTEGHSYDYLKLRLDIPCCKDTYYALYRRFFWLLSKTRN